MGAAAGRLRQHGDGRPFAGSKVGEDRGDAERVAGMLSRDRGEAGPDVGGPAGHDTFDGHELEGDIPVLRRDHGGGGHRPGGGLDRCHAAAVRRIAQRSAEVVAQAERTHPGGQGRGFAAARPARGTLRVPRVAGQAMQRRVGVDAQAEVRQVGTADGDRAGRAQLFHLRGVDRGDRLSQGRDRLGSGGARQVDVLLDRARDAVQRAKAGAVRHRPVGRVRGREGLVWEEADDGVELRVDRLDAIQVRLDNLAAVDFAIADQSREFDSALAPQFAHATPSGSRSRPT